MTAAIGPQEWLHFIDKEYFSTFVLDGGSAIKFAVPLDGLAGISLRSGYLVVNINASETKVHMIDEIFFRTAQQMPWQILIHKIIAKLAAELGYSWINGEEGPIYQRLADHNHVDPQLLILKLKKSIGEHVFKKRNLARDFRVAITHLCLVELSGGQDGSATTSVLTHWLTGQNKAVSAVKPYQIFRKINRHTARHFFELMIHWIRFAGYPGTVVLLDAQRVMLPKKLHNQSLFYSKAAVVNTYEVFRQFIDSADQLEGCLITVVPDISFLEVDSRGISAYEALKFRIVDEIRDKSLVNPMASLARIAATAKETAAMETKSKIDFRRALEALRNGVSNKDAVSALRSNQPDAEKAFLQRLTAVQTFAGEGKQVSGLLTAGGFGAGKSHALDYFEHLAVSKTFVCSRVVTSKETPLFDPSKDYLAAIDGAVVPGLDAEAIREIALTLQPEVRQYAEFVEWANRPTSGLSEMLMATLLIHERLNNDPELLDHITNFWSGEPLSISRIRLGLKQINCTGAYSLKSIKVKDLALQRFLFVSRLILLQLGAPRQPEG